jgi:uncharacterized SAM-binding protein YcdF (DUF218 family)
MVVLSIGFVYISLTGGAGWGNIGTWFPSFYFLLLLIVTYNLEILKKWLRKAYLPLIAVFYSGMILFLAAFIIFCFLILSYTSVDIPENPDVVIVLGCQVYGYTPGILLKTRLDAALETLNKYPGSICVVSGGQGPDETMPEAQTMKKYLSDRGIDENRIYEENKSSSSFENLSYSKKIIEENNIKCDNIVILTSEYHVPRAVLIAKRVYPDIHIKHISAVKATSPFNMFGAGIMREFFAFVKSFVFDRV